MRKINTTAIRIAIVAILAIAIIGRIGLNLYREHDRVRTLRQTDGYELYYTYVKIRDANYAYFMINDEKIDAQNAHTVLSDERIASYNERRAREGYGDYPIVVYLIMPTEELPYGWQKSEANIAANFDTAVFHQNTVCRVTIPMGAVTLADCAVDYE